VSVVMVRYRVRPDAASENERLIRAVMAELSERAPEGLRYTVSVEEDGVTFVHVASHSGEVRLTDFPAFQAFLASHRDRCEEGPVTTQLRVVGSY
jgi:hypothetical protein